ncbi:hypothetical protein [Sinorhizobium sp. BG8]|uniref:hypothetical protein n=1 Tax=Sinorhizobium sp. BG8 TaxID=2613773 RepID=UPI00193CB752|nr:hypothetical protein [Sinorhizobium sp. BG8]QRM53912.1 hypothetical protein F3Y30_04600 [Sinorhizobium sp. BG8]
MNEDVPEIQTADDNILLKIPKPRLPDSLDEILRPKTQIAHRYSVSANIDEARIAAFFQAIDAVAKKSGATECVNFSVDVLYDDGSSKSFRSVDALLLNSHTVHATSISAVLRLTYLVKFAGRDLATEQDINVYVTSNRSGVQWLRGSTSSEPNLVISVSTTRLPWAEGIIRRFSRHVRNEFGTVGRLSKAISSLYFRRPTSFLIHGLAVAVLALFSVFYLDDCLEQVLRIRSAEGEISRIAPISSLSDKASVLMDLVRTDPLSLVDPRLFLKYLFYSLTVLIVFFILPVAYADFSARSYVSIGKVSEHRNRKASRSLNSIMLCVIGCAVLLLAASLTISRF